MIDAHAHLRGRPPPGADAFVVPGLDAARDAEAAALAAADPRVVRAVGLHPFFLPADDAALAAALDDLRARASLPGVVAVGECGLDKGRQGRGADRAAGRARQERALVAQIGLAAARRLPLVLHVVGRPGRTLQLLRAHRHDPALGGMVHDFAGPTELVADWVAAGFFLSISPRALRRDRVGAIAAIPEDRLLVETDDAGPEHLPAVVAAVAAARGSTPQAIAALTAQNARRLFRLPLPNEAPPR